MPNIIQERRRSLIPKLIEFRTQGKRAALVRDRLYVDGVEYKHQTQ